MHFDSYLDAGVFASVALVNELLVRLAADTSSGFDPTLALPALAQVLAIDPPSVAQLGPDDVPGFVALAHELRACFAEVRSSDIDAAAGRLNALLAKHPAHPHLAKEQGRWRLHHHPVEAALVPMWTAICAEALARVIGTGQVERLGTCERPACGRVFLDVSKNASRRFCSTTCQNRVKVAAYRRRRDSTSE